MPGAPTLEGLCVGMVRMQTSCAPPVFLQFVWWYCNYGCLLIYGTIPYKSHYTYIHTQNPAGGYNNPMQQLQYAPSSSQLEEHWAEKQYAGWLEKPTAAWVDVR